MAMALKVVRSAAWLDQVLEDFERAMLRRQMSPATVRIYRWAIADLFRLMKEGYGRNEITGLDREVLERWQDGMVQRKMRASSRSLAVTAARQLLKWCVEQELVDFRLERALSKVRVVQGRPRPIPPEDLDKIKRYLLPRRPHMGIVALRDRALFFYLLTTGARVSEALQVRRDEIESAVVVQKGGTEKTLMLPPEAADLVVDYLRARIDDSPWLWISHRTNSPLGRLGPPGVRTIWQKLARKLGIAPWTTHQLRHTCATELLEAGVPELVVAEHLGHHGTGTLHIYGQVRGRQRQQAIDVMGNLVQSTPRPVLLPTIRKGRY